MDRSALQISPEALFRYQWVAELEARVSAGETLSQAIEAVRRQPRSDPQGRPRRLSTRTLYRWLAAYREGGIAALEPQVRPRISTSRALEDELVAFVREAKTQDPDLSIPDLIESARTAGVLGAEEPLSRTTVWRAARRMGLRTSRRRALATSDTRRFTYPHRMMMVLADGKYFRAGAGRRKRVALCFLDDATRFGLGVVVGTSETTRLFLYGLHEVLLRWGLMNALYLDRGPGFISNDTKAVFARLHRPLIHGRRRYPQGHGKIERFHRTLVAKVLRHLDANAEIDPDCSALTLRLSHWLKERYNHTPHESLDQETPSQRWHRDPRPLVMPEDRAWLDAQFLVTEERTVSNDHVVSLDGIDYEVPKECSGRIAIERHLLSERLVVRLEHKPIEIHPLDPVRNAFERRARPQGESTAPTTPRTVAAEDFDLDFGPIVSEDGDYPETEEDP